MSTAQEGQPLDFHPPRRPPPRYQDIEGRETFDFIPSTPNETYRRVVKELYGILCFAIAFHTLIFLLHLITVAVVQHSANQMVQFCKPKFDTL